MQSIARAAYEAYRVHTGSRTWDGRPMPEWQDLGARIQRAWAAAAAVAAPADVAPAPVPADLLDLLDVAAQHVDTAAALGAPLFMTPPTGTALARLLDALATLLRSEAPDSAVTEAAANLARSVLG
ncbi:hypothetical protein [Kitasatospora sp. NPDC002965]|uniref:hypothetical protein n=1 Tax=Kitasatospora sp. NPDC002965 TaxID=3154775 RepID=UPI0033B7AD71